MIAYPTADDLNAVKKGITRSAASRLLKCYVLESTGCWRWIKGKTTVGYGHFSIRRVYYQAHRLMFILHRGPVALPTLDHLCRNRWCVNPWHLEPVTHQENMRRGSRTRLNPSLVRQIRAALASGITQRQVAPMFDIDHSTVSRIATGNRWADIDQPATTVAA